MVESPTGPWPIPDALHLLVGRRAEAHPRAQPFVCRGHVASALHTHERPYLILAVTPMQLKVTGPDGSAMTDEVKAGDFHWIDTKVTHSLTNAGTAEGEIVEIELK